MYINNDYKRTYLKLKGHSRKPTLIWITILAFYFKDRSF